MKAVVAFVQPFMVARVVEALHQISGLSGATFERARGFGRGRAPQHRASDEEGLARHRRQGPGRNDGAR